MLKNNKTKVIVMGLGYATERFVKENQDNDYVELIGLVLDTSVEMEEQKRFVDRIKSCIDIFELSHETLLRADIIFMPEYRRIIPNEYCDKYCIVNCHGGILPKWRGFAANAWAIMNNEKEIGYSIHRVRSELDGGELYFVKHIPIADDETYSDVHDIMIDSIVNDVPEMLYKIHNGEIIDEKQSTSEVAYCTKFHSDMGELRFDRTSEYYVNLYRCMAKPLGSGVYFIYKGEKYFVNRVENGNIYGIANYLCEEGKIVNIENKSLYVKVKDGVIVLSEIEKNGVILPLESFKNGMFLGGGEWVNHNNLLQIKILILTNCIMSSYYESK